MRRTRRPLRCYRPGSVITVGTSGAFGIGGMVITEGSDGRRGRCGGSTAGGWAGGCAGWWGGAPPGGAAGGRVVVAVPVVVAVVAAVVVVDDVAVDEVVPGAGALPPGPRLVNWTMPQNTRAIMIAIRTNQPISTDRRRNQGLRSGPVIAGKPVDS